MWVRLDDGFATHPKLVVAGAIPTLIQIRAICYASQHKTDGFIPAAVVHLFLGGLKELMIEARDSDWAPEMVRCGLWEACPGGYMIHDYLEWNMSKKDYDSFIAKKRKAGKKGMKARWSKRLSKITEPITDVITQSYHPTSTSSLNSLNSPNPDWLLELKKNKIYAHVDFDRELGKMFVWKNKPANRKRQITESFVINWLNKIEPPLALSNGKVQPPPFPPQTDPIARNQWRQAYGDPKQYGY